MTGKIYTVIILFMFLLVSISGDLGCAQEKSNISLSSKKSVPSPQPPLPRVARSVLSWPKGSITNVEKVIGINANIVHTFPGLPGARGFRPPAMIEEGMGKMWRDEVDKLHEAGIRVFASQASTGFQHETFIKYGLNPDLYGSSG